MAEYIEREAVLKIIYDIKENKEIPKNYGTLLDIIRSIRNLPTADVVEVRHGHWKWKELYGETGYMLVCSECEESEGACERYDYCPNCGAKMDGKG